MLRSAILKIVGLALFLVGWGATHTVWAEDTLTIATWGGAYEKSQEIALFAPFTEKTGIKIETVPYSGSIEPLKLMDLDDMENHWDIVDMVMSDNMEACDLGLIEPIDHELLLDAPDGTPATEDFFPNTLAPCGVANVMYAMVIAFNIENYHNQRPRRVADLFDLEMFPGKRALPRNPHALVEWALRSYDVPVSDLYNLLSTNRGIDLAFRKLTQIKDHIIWWDEPDEAVNLLVSGEALMAAGYNGRFFNAAVYEKHPIQTMWDGHVYEYGMWSIVKNTPRRDMAERFINFATETARMAEQAKYISYGPARSSAVERVWMDSGGAVDIRSYLPTHPTNLAKGIAKDYEWYSQVQDRLKHRFSQWIQENEL